MRIYIDFDDVLCETARRLSELARERFARDVPYEAIQVFDLQEAFALSDEELGRLMAHAHEPDFLERLAPSPGGLEALRELEARGHELAIVTGRPASCHGGSRAWLGRHGLGHLEVIYFDKYGRAAPSGAPDEPKTLSRAEFDRLHFDVAIDDAPAALEQLAHRADCTVIVYNRPWNRRYAASASMRRTDSWPEIVSLIGELP